MFPVVGLLFPVCLPRVSLITGGFIWFTGWLFGCLSLVFFGWFSGLEVWCWCLVLVCFGALVWVFAVSFVVLVARLATSSALVCSLVGVAFCGW